MKAVAFNEYGAPDVLEPIEIPRPMPAADEVLVEIHASGINPFDAKIRRGYLTWFYQVEFPYVPGADFAGLVVRRGADVSALDLGDKVWGMTWPPHQGAYAEYIAVKADGIRRMPSNLNFEQAAVMPMACMTAFYALHDMVTLTPGQRVLIHAGAGGVGSYAIQVAKKAGCWVATTCSTANVDYCKALGADLVVDYQTQDFSALVKDCDIAIDQVGGETSLKTYESMKRGGTILLVERGHKLEMEHRAANVAKYGVELREVAFENVPDALDRMRDAVEAGWLKSTLERVIGMEEIEAVHAQLDRRHIRGKVAMVIR